MAVKKLEREEPAAALLADMTLTIHWSTWSKSSAGLIPEPGS